MRRGYVPRVWKVWAVAKLVMTTCVTLATGPQRLAQMRSMASGMRDALAAVAEPIE